MEGAGADRIMSSAALFLDTSIQISRFFKSDDLKRRIHDQLSKFDLVLTGLVVRNEFRRRVLGEAQYLLRLIDRYKSARRVQQHINDQLGGWQNQRKRNICLDLLATFYPRSDDKDHTDRLRSLLRSLLVGGMEEFDESVDAVVQASGCECAKQTVREIESYKKYEIGSSSCKDFGSRCRIQHFLAEKIETIRAIETFLKSVPVVEKSDELKAIEAAMSHILSESQNSAQLDLCKTVGDLLIALESSNVPAFYTQNIRESQHLCAALKQTMIYRDNHPEHDDVISGTASII
jgi:hypothetical protein